MQSSICGGLSSTSAIFIMHPVDVVKTRLQFQSEMKSTTGGKHTTKAYRSILGSIFQIYK